MTLHPSQGFNINHNYNVPLVRHNKVRKLGNIDDGGSSDGSTGGTGPHENWVGSGEEGERLGPKMMAKSEAKKQAKRQEDKPPANQDAGTSDGNSSQK